MNTFRAFMELDTLNESASLKEYTYDNSYHKVEVVYENDKYTVELHPDAPKNYWVIDKSLINPLHAEETFYDIDRAIDYANTLANQLTEASCTRAECIAKLKAAGKNYRFDKYSDAQLYRIVQRLEQENKKEVTTEVTPDVDYEEDAAQCDFCGYTLNGLGQCPVCDLGEEDLFEGIFDARPITRSNWISSNGAPIKPNNQNINNSSTAASKAGGQPKQNNIITIVYDSSKHKLRAQADDGVHGVANVAFPNHLRNQAGQQYVVDGLIWNGKNYRVSGTIVPITKVQNINGQIIKENYKMNFQNVFSELSKLYESAEQTKKIAFMDCTGSSEAFKSAYEKRIKADGFEGTVNTVTDTAMKAVCDAVNSGDDVTLYTRDDDYKTNCKDIVGKKNFKVVMIEKTEESLTEDVDEEEVTDIEVEVGEDEQEEVVRQLAIQCKNCGAIVIKDESEVDVDENGVANAEDKCEFCEETKGSDIVGVVTPYEADDEEVEVADDEEIEIVDDESGDESGDEAVEEGLFDFGKKKHEKEAAAKKAADDAKAKIAAEKEAEAKYEADRVAQYKRDEAEREKRDRELKRQYERDRYNSIKGDTPSNTGHRGINYSGGDYYSEDIDADGITEGYSVKYGRGGDETTFDSLEDAVQHINDGMQSKKENSYVLYNNGKEMIWLDWYQASRDGSNNDYTVSRQNDTKTIKFEPKVGLSIIGDLEERLYDDEVGSGWDRSTPYSSQSTGRVFGGQQNDPPQWWKDAGRSAAEWSNARRSSINSWDDDNRYNR